MPQNTIKFLGKKEMKEFEKNFPDSASIIREMQEPSKTLAALGKNQLFLGFVNWSRLYVFMEDASGLHLDLGCKTGSLPEPTLAEAFLEEYSKKSRLPLLDKRRNELSSKLFLPAIQHTKKHIIYPTPY